jgi:putative oxidoreductase
MTTYEAFPLVPYRESALPLADRVAGGATIWLAGRAVLGGLFLMSGIEKLAGLDQFAAGLVKGGIPESMAAMIAPVGAIVETLGGLAILVGFLTNWASLLMIAFVVIGTFISHRFWEFQGDVRQLQMFNFEKNVMLVGAFCMLHVAGGGPYSIDRWWRKRNGMP